MTIDVDKIITQAAINLGTNVGEIPPYPLCAEAVRLAIVAAIDEAAGIAAAHFIPGHTIAGPRFAEMCAKKIKSLAAEYEKGADHV